MAVTCPKSHSTARTWFLVLTPRVQMDRGPFCARANSDQQGRVSLAGKVQSHHLRQYLP